MKPQLEEEDLSTAILRLLQVHEISAEERPPQIPLWVRRTRPEFMPKFRGGQMVFITSREDLYLPEDAGDSGVVHHPGLDQTVVAVDGRYLRLIHNANLRLIESAE